MLSTIINNDDLSVKYILGNYKDVSSYPDKFDAMYEIYSMFEMLEKKPKELLFPEKLYLKRFEDEGKAKQLLDKLLVEGYVEVAKTTATKVVYRVAKHPWRINI